MILYGVRLSLVADGDAWWRRPDALRACGYALFHQADPKLAEDLHAGTDLRPFTLAAREDDRGVSLRVTSLDSATSRALERVHARALTGLMFDVGTARARISGAAPPVGMEAGATYLGLARAPFPTRVSLAFRTPTAFSQGGDCHLPLPVPDLMLRSWARRWNHFRGRAPEIPEEVLAKVAGHVALARARIDTSGVTLYRGKVVGFTGEVTLEALRPDHWTEGERSVFAALTTYSRFCGTGVRTTQGMGVTLPAIEGKPHRE